MPRHERLHENMLNAQKCRRRKAQEREMLRRLLDFATNCAETSGLPANLSESLEAMRTSWQGITLMRGQRDTQGSLNAFLEAMGPAMDLAMDPPPPNDGSFGGFDKLTLPELPELDSYSNNEDGGHKEQSIESSESSGSEHSGNLSGFFVAAEDLSSLPYFLGETLVEAEEKKGDAAMMDFDAELNNLLAA